MSTSEEYVRPGDESGARHRHVIPQNKAAHVWRSGGHHCGAFIASRSPNGDYLVAGKIDRPLGMNGVEAIVITRAAGRGPSSHLPVVPGLPGYADGGATYGTLRRGRPAGDHDHDHAPELLPRRDLQRLAPLARPHASRAAAGRHLRRLRRRRWRRRWHKRSWSTQASISPTGRSCSTSIGPGIETFAHGFHYRLSRRRRLSDRTRSLLDRPGLAQVQENSQPDSTPTTYFTGETNFALVLLGDPACPADVRGRRRQPPARASVSNARHARAWSKTPASGNARR